MLRKTLTKRILAVASATLLSMGQAVSADESEFLSVSELSNEGYVAFGTSGAVMSLFGMQNPETGQIYLCFSADSPLLSAKRVQVITDTMSGTNQDRMVPSIPVICVMTE